MFFDMGKHPTSLFLRLNEFVRTPSSTGGRKFKIWEPGPATRANSKQNPNITPASCPNTAVRLIPTLDLNQNLCTWCKQQPTNEIPRCFLSAPQTDGSFIPTGHSGSSPSSWAQLSWAGIRWGLFTLSASLLSLRAFTYICCLSIQKILLGSLVFPTPHLPHPSKAPTSLLPGKPLTSWDP